MKNILLTKLKIFNIGTFTKDILPRLTLLKGEESGGLRLLNLL